MNANNFKVLLCCYTIGIAGCNKIGNPSYMDSGGDGTSEKRQDVKASSSAVQSGSIDCDRLLQHSLNVIKRRADTSERVAISQQKAADRAIQDAANARRTADMARKTADDREKARLELGGGDTLPAVGMMSKTDDDREKESRLKLGAGGDVL